MDLEVRAGQRPRADAKCQRRGESGHDTHDGGDHQYEVGRDQDEVPMTAGAFQQAETRIRNCAARSSVSTRS